MTVAALKRSRAEPKVSPFQRFGTPKEIADKEEKPQAKQMNVRTTHLKEVVLEDHNFAVDK